MRKTLYSLPHLFAGTNVFKIERIEDSFFFFFLVENPQAPFEFFGATRPIFVFCVLFLFSFLVAGCLSYGC